MKRKATAILSGVVAASLAGGVAAQFTTSTISEPQKIGTGTLALALDSVAPMTWTDEISNLAAGDSVERFVDLRNSGSLKIAGVSLGQTNTLGALLTDPSDISIKLQSCSVAWNVTDGTCTGEATSVLDPSSVSAWGNDRKALAGLNDFAAGDIAHLKVTTTLKATATNAVQNKNGTITYTFGGVQRTGGTWGQTGEGAAPVVQPTDLLTQSHATGAVDVSFTDTNNGQATYTLTYQKVAVAQRGMQRVAMVTGNAESGRVELPKGQTSYTFTGLTPGAQYTFGLEARRGNQSVQLSTSGTPATPAVAVDDLKTSSSATGQIEASWTDVNNGTAAYTLTATPADGSAAVSVTLPAGTSAYTFTGLKAGVAYAVAVSAAKNGEVQDSAPVAATPATAVVAAGQIKATSTDAGSATVSFVDTNAETASYELGYARTGQDQTRIKLAAGEFSHTLTGLTPGADYTFTVYALKNGASESIAASATIGTAALAPADLKAISTATGNLAITFTDTNAGSATYDLTYVPTSGGTPVTVPVTGTSITLNDLTPGSGYTLTLSATKFGQHQSVSTTATVATALVAPGSVSAVVNAAHAANVSFSDTNAGTATYSLSYAPTAGGAATSVDLAPGATSATVSGLTAGVEYTFTVTAAKLGKTQSASAKVAAQDDIKAVTSLVATSTAAGAQTLTWSDTNAGQGAYSVRYAPAAGGAPITVPVPAGQNTLTLTGLTQGAAYTYTVITTKFGQTLETSTSGTPATALVAPSGFGALSSQTGSLTVAWTDTNAGTASYALKYRLQGTSAWTNATLGAGATGVTLTGLTPGSVYELALSATKNGESTTVSTTGTPATAAVAPGDFAATSTAAGSVTLSWVDTNKASATYSLVYTSGGVSTTVSLPSTATSYSLSGLTQGADYSFVLTAAKNGETKSASATTTVGTAVKAATGLSAASTDTGNLQVAYTDTNAGSATYSLSYAPTSGGTPVVVPVSGGAATLSNLTPGVEYTLVLSATKYGQSLSTSVVATAATALVAPGSLAAVPNAGGALAFSFADTNAGTASYSLSYAPTAGGTPVTVPLAAGVSSYTATGLSAGTEYTFTLTGTKLGKSSSSTIKATPEAAVKAATGLTATSTAAGAQTLAWTNTNGSGYVSYSLSYVPTAGGTTQTVSIPAGQSSYTLTGLSQGTGYTYTLTATKFGQGATTTVTGTPALALKDVTDLATTSTAVGAATVSFTDTNAGSATYALSYAPTAGGASTSVALAGATSKTITGLTGGTEYTFTLVSTKNGETKTVTSKVTATSAAVAPSALVATSAAVNTQTITWADTNAGAASHTITYGLTGGTTTTVSVPAGQNSYTITGLTGGSGYTYTVTATKLGTTASSSVTGVPGKAAVAVSGLAATHIAASTETLSWTDTNSGAANYTITYVPTAGGTTQTMTSAAGSTSATIAGLTAGTQYTFTVTANRAGTTAAATVNSTPEAAVQAATGVTATAGASSATVAWTNNNGSAVSYQVLYTPAGGTQQTATVAAGQNTATITGLTVGTSYSFVVRATKFGSSMDAAAVSATPFAVQTQTYLATGNGYSGTQQTYTVPATGKYKVEAYGAQGGSIGGRTGGVGAYATGNVYLTASQGLTIVVGQQGIGAGQGAGGGGGTFVLQGTTPLVVGGGGGGAASYSSGASNGLPGQTGTAGANATLAMTSGCTSNSATGMSNGGGFGGANGYGGGAGCAGGGAGVFSAGALGGHQAPGGNTLPSLTGGISTNSSGLPHGGYGGGGAGSPSNGYGGGGGGYSGGGGGQWSGSVVGAGGGGGSYVVGTFNGVATGSASTSNTTNARTGNGMVVITYVGP